ncbi:MAG: hypothetical protein ACI85B_001458, partial [Flavobacteriaceae bacterium]
MSKILILSIYFYKETNVNYILWIYTYEFVEKIWNNSTYV